MQINPARCDRHPDLPWRAIMSPGPAPDKSVKGRTIATNNWTRRGPKIGAEAVRPAAPVHRQRAVDIALRLRSCASAEGTLAGGRGEAKRPRPPGLVRPGTRPAWLSGLRPVARQPPPPSPRKERSPLRVGAGQAKMRANSRIMSVAEIGRRADLLDRSLDARPPAGVKVTALYYSLGLD